MDFGKPVHKQEEKDVAVESPANPANPVENHAKPNANVENRVKQKNAANAAVNLG